MLLKYHKNINKKAFCFTFRFPFGWLFPWLITSLSIIHMQKLLHFVNLSTCVSHSLSALIDISRKLLICRLIYDRRERVEKVYEERESERICAYKSKLISSTKCKCWICLLDELIIWGALACEKHKVFNSKNHPKKFRVWVFLAPKCFDNFLFIKNSLKSLHEKLNDDKKREK